MVRKKVLVLDLDETLIHSHHDGVLRPSVKPGTPPDFILKVTIDKHPVRFFVHKRPHVDFFLSVVSPDLHCDDVEQLYYSSGRSVVRAGGLHGQHGDLRAGRGGQVGLQPGDVEQEVLQAALHPRLRIVHQGSLRHLCGLVQHLHLGQFSWSL